ncbi:MAG TPA: amidohydrolase family protein [Longimicrobiales bacterium]|nr:amidohydrolase family protein [Longimicrobiales bacterium]
MRLNSHFMLLSLALVLPGELVAQDRAPIIDMHMHASNVQLVPDGKPVPVPLRCYPGPCEGGPAAAETEEEVLRMTLAAMDRHNIVLGFLSGYDGTSTSLAPNLERVRTWVDAAPGRFIPAAFVAQPGTPTIEVLRNEYAAGRLEGLGEIATQYYGYRPDDLALAPYFALAAELDIPTHIHTAGIGAALPTFRTTAGNPLWLEEVLARHSDLRLFVENSGFPFTQEWIALAYQYPQLYGEVSTATWIVNRSAFNRHLRALVEAGLSKRIMFGSDQMQWPETIALAIEAIETADFLTEEQKRDILYNNAARFLGLSQEQIAAHHRN